MPVEMFFFFAYQTCHLNLGQKTVLWVKIYVFWSFRPKIVFLGQKLSFFRHFVQKAVLWVKNDVFWSFRTKNCFMGKKLFFGYIGVNNVF